MIKRIPISIKFEAEEPLYKELVEPARMNKELSTLIADLLGTYFEDMEVRERVALYQQRHSPYSAIHEELERIQREHMRNVVLTDSMRGYMGSGGMTADSDGPVAGSAPAQPAPPQGAETTDFVASVKWLQEVWPQLSQVLTSAGAVISSNHALSAPSERSKVSQPQVPPEMKSPAPYADEHVEPTRVEKETDSTVEELTRAIVSEPVIQAPKPPETEVVKTPEDKPKKISSAFASLAGSLEAAD